MDWSIKQLVSNYNGNIILFTDGSCSETRFGGTVVQHKENPDMVGMYIFDCYKHAYQSCELTANFKTK